MSKIDQALAQAEQGWAERGQADPLEIEPARGPWPFTTRHVFQLHKRKEARSLLPERFWQSGTLFKVKGPCPLFHLLPIEQCLP